MNPLQRLRNWTMRLPNIWGLGQAEIHSSLFVLLGALSLLVILVSCLRPGFNELLPCAVTLPLVWLASLTVRVAAQQLLLGEQALDMETVIGPTGNLSTDYEYLPAKRMLFYSLAGQLATVGLALLGFVVSAAMIQAETTELSVAHLLDLTSGWRSEAWASQIMWINLFLCVLHTLPTVPFDMRATVIAFFSLSQGNAQEPRVFRTVASFVSHLAAFMLGVGAMTVAFGWLYHREIVGWYAAVAAAVYLFVAGQWEASRAEELEEQYAPLPPRRRRDRAEIKQPHLKFGTSAIEPAKKTADEHSFSSEDILGDLVESEAKDAVDIDEILRKIHREGRSALSASEQQALLSASRELKERRGQAK